jgi:ribosomal protein S18 acetylase RimI-like enzyme
VEDKVITYAYTSPHAQLPSYAPAVIRPARSSDTDDILRINAVSFGPFWQYDDAVVLAWVLSSDRAIVAEVQGRVAGFAVTTQGLAGNYAHLIRVATDFAYRGRGVGRQLVVDAIQFARDASAPGLALNTQSSNRISRRLYESLGFRQTGHVLSAMVCRL